MYAASASGKKLDPYVVYKAKRLQAAWVMGGSRTAFYNTSPSGWFDAKIFEDWFDKVALPYFNSSNEPGNKIIIGDNVPSHINPDVVRKAEANNIKFIFLPPNSTHILQPLDVAVFRTLKAEWRKSLTSWKLHEGRKLAVMPKWAVPDLLRRLDAAMAEKWGALAQAGFRSSGIYPFSPDHLMRKVFGVEEDPSPLNESLIAYLEERRLASETEARGRGRQRRLQIPPGQAVCVADLE